MKKNKPGPFFPITTLFLALTTIYFLGFRLLQSWGFDIRVLVIANLILFTVTYVSFLVGKSGLQSSNPHAFIRSAMGSIMIKFSACIIAALIYIMIYKTNINKPALFTSMGLYLVYSFLEVSILTRMMKQQKNA